MNTMNIRANMIQDYDARLILRDARREARVSQEELAKRTKTTKSYISRIENGVIVPSVAVFYRMIAALGMSVQIKATIS